MNLLFWALTVGTVGKVLLGIGVIIVHHKMAEERIINQEVLGSFRLEHIITIMGLIMIVIGYGMEIYFYNLTSMLTCVGQECAQGASAVISQ